MFLLLLYKQKDTYVDKQTTDVTYLLYIKRFILSINAGKHLKLNMLLTKSQFIWYKSHISMKPTQLR